MTIKKIADELIRTAVNATMQRMDKSNRHKQTISIYIQCQSSSTHTHTLTTLLGVVVPCVSVFVTAPLNRKPTSWTRKKNVANVARFSLSILSDGNGTGLGFCSPKCICQESLPPEAGSGSQLCKRRQPKPSLLDHIGQIGRGKDLSA